MNADIQEAAERFGGALRAARQARDLTQGELAGYLTQLGVPLHLNLISRIEGGGRWPDLPEILALAAALNVTPDQLMGTAPGPLPAVVANHYHAAEKCLSWADGADPDSPLQRSYLAAAQVHATLALVSSKAAR